MNEEMCYMLNNGKTNLKGLLIKSPNVSEEIFWSFISGVIFLILTYIMISRQDTSIISIVSYSMIFGLITFSIMYINTHSSTTTKPSK